MNLIRQIACFLCRLLSKTSATVDIPSPRDIIPQRDIIYFPDTERLVITNIKPKVWITTVQDTNSMDPTVDAGHTCILISSFKKSDLVVGDVVVYWNGHRDILHRIIKMSTLIFYRK